MEKQGVIYKIENTVNGKMYIGQTRKLLCVRKQEHLKKLRKDKHYNVHLQRAFNLHGEKAFNFDVLEKCSVEELNGSEIFWIDFYETTLRDKGYNFEGGGGAKKEVSIESRERMSKNSARKKGVICLSENKRFESLSAAAEYYGVSKGAISQVCSGAKSHVKGHKFAYEGDELASSKDFIGVDLRSEKHRADNKVICLNDGRLYNSASDAAKYYGLSRSFVSLICRGVRKSKDGLIFKYYSEHTSN